MGGISTAPLPQSPQQKVSMDNSKDTSKVILCLDSTKLVMSISAAAAVFKILCEENLQTIATSYNKDEVTGEYRSTVMIKAAKSDQVSIQYLSHAEYMRACAAGDSDD